MPKVLGVLILATLAAVLACGGDRLTAREYAEACNDLGGQVSSLDNLDIDAVYSESPDDVDAAFEDIRDVIQEYKRLNPPNSLQDLHDARVEGMDFLDDEMLPLLQDALSHMEDAFSAMEDGDEDELGKIQEEMAELEEEIEALEDELDGLTEAAEEAFEDLSPRNQEILQDADCG